ncbi:MAG: hypothetical protein JEZ03_07000 [Bacteroidales bacterium]|nr:hypothetical protein [Bacteroidales bacterium]
MNKKLKLISVAILLLAGITLKAQDSNENKEEIARPLQITFFSPLGTNGIDSWKITNRLSINIIAGVNGGLHGVEIGGLANVLKGDMHGLQASGFVNHVMGSAEGLQAAGFYNYTNKEFRGGQFSGFLNVSAGRIEGIQLSGFLNYANSGYVSQGSAFVNVNLGEVKGFQIAGFANISTNEIEGVQASGYYNHARGIKGVQASGFMNLVSGNVDGVQVSGFLNIAKRLNGAQIGFINVVDTLESGVALGFLSFVGNGYKAFEISGNESQYAVMNFKTGTRSFYNILSLGARAQDEEILWGFGYGIGSMVPLSNKVALNLEVLGYHMNEDEWFTENLNELYKAQAVFSVDLTKHLAIYGGPSWNVTVTDTDACNGQTFESSVAPWTAFDKNYEDDINIKMYPGFTAGIRIF